MSSWQVDKQKADRYLPAIKRILGEYLIQSAPYEEDAQRNTDLIVLRLDAVRVACRVRSHSYFLRYPNEFTIRSGRPNGTKTELAKIIEGWGDYFFYGFAANGDEAEFAYWVLGDLHVFRLWFAREMMRNKGRVPGTELKNGDGSSTFHAFSINELPPAFVVAQGYLLPTLKKAIYQEIAY